MLCFSDNCDDDDFYEDNCDDNDDDDDFYEDNCDKVL